MCRAAPLQARHDLFGLTHHVLDNLRGGFDVVYETARLPRVEGDGLHIPPEASDRGHRPVFRHLHRGASYRDGTNNRPLPRTLPTRRATRSLPLRERGVAQHPVWRTGPAAIKERGIHRILGRAADDTLLVDPGSTGFRAAEKPRPHGHGLRPQAEGSHHTTACGNPPSGEHRHRSDRRDYRWHEGGQRGTALHMAPRFDPLDNDRIDACIGRRRGFLDGSYLEEDLSGMAMRLDDVGPGIPPKEHQERHPFGQASIDLPFQQEGQNEIHPKQFICQGAEPVERLAEGGGWQEQPAQHATAASIRHRGGEFWASNRPHTNGENGIGKAKLRAERGVQHISSSRGGFTCASSRHYCAFGRPNNVVRDTDIAQSSIAGCSSWIAGSSAPLWSEKRISSLKAIEKE